MRWGKNPNYVYFRSDLLADLSRVLVPNVAGLDLSQNNLTNTATSYTTICATSARLSRAGASQGSGRSTSPAPTFAMRVA